MAQWVPAVWEDRLSLLESVLKSPSSAVYTPKKTMDAISQCWPAPMDDVVATAGDAMDVDVDADDRTCASTGMFGTGNGVKSTPCPKCGDTSSIIINDGQDCTCTKCGTKYHKCGNSDIPSGGYGIKVDCSRCARAKDDNSMSYFS